MTKILPVILCGGSGTRMWPASRETLPKQFIPLLGARSTFQNIAAVTAASELFEAPVIISNQDYRFLVAEQLKEIGVRADIVLEPMRRDSGPAVAVAAELAYARSPGTIVAVMAADHAVQKTAALVDLCREAATAAADGFIVTLGIEPDHAATGYGYIRMGAAIAGSAGVFKVEAFVEKPDAATAETYVAEGYVWNSGNFFFRADIMRAEIERLAPDMAKAAAAAVAAGKKDLDFFVLDARAFAAAPKISIDYAVMEKTHAAAVVPADIGWSDVGTWAAVRTLAVADAQGNSTYGDGIVMGGRNVHVRSEDRLTAVVGLSDIIVVTTDDAVLVLDAKQSGLVKDLVEQLKRDNRREALEHRRIYRPWGYYQSIDHGARYQVKRIVVKPQGQLSLQKHFHRAEHWVVVKGAAEVVLGETTQVLHENESIYLPIGSVHRLTNPGKIDLELIEVQTGSYLGEDDIVRLQDIYHRG